MSAFAVSLRSAGALLAASLVGTGLVALAGATPVAGACPATYTDPAGDAALGDAATHPVTEDDGLDIVAVTHSVDAGVFTSTIKVVKLLDSGPHLAFGDRFVSSFTVAKKTVTVTAERDFSGVGSIKGSATVAGTAVTFPVKVVQDLKASTISATMAAADLEKAVAAPLAGEPFSAMSAVARAIYPSNAGPSVGALWDSATAPATASYSFGAGCGGAAAAPAGAASPSASPSPTASSSPSPSASPSPSGSPTPSGSPPASATAGATSAALPLPGCGLSPDPKGDAKALNANNPSVDPDLDLTHLTFGTTGDALVAYAKIDKLGAGPTQSTDGHRFTFYFTHNKNVFALAGSAYKNAQSATVKNGLAATGQFSKVTQLSVNGPPLTDPNGRTNPGFVDSGLKFTFDQKNSYVIASLPIADIVKYGKAPFAEATLSGIYATSATDTTTVSSQADVVPDGAPTTKPSTLTYTAGDNACFAPTAPPLSSVGAVRAQFGDTAAVAAKLVDGSGAPATGKAVTFTLGASKVTGTTGADGVAKAQLPVREKAGKRSLLLSAGDVQTSAVFTVLLEKTAMTASGAAGSVTATLTDDDRKAVAGQVVTFTSGARKVTARTDAKGVAKAGGFPVDSAVKVAYAGVSGMYSGSTASATA